MIGIDIVSIARFNRVLQTYYASSFLRRVFSNNELKLLDERLNHSRVKSLAGRFAVKEAVIKASQGELKLDDLANIETSKGKNGEPLVHINVKGFSGHFEISLSHDGDYAIAVAYKTK